MKIINCTFQKANISLSKKELMVLKKAILKINKIIPICEYNLRLEASQKVIEEFCQLISRLIEQAKNSIKIEKQFTFQEINLINNILNEICNGKKINDFEVEIGASFEEVDEFSLLICKLGKKMYAMRKKTL